MKAKKLSVFDKALGKIENRDLKPTPAVYNLKTGILPTYPYVLEFEGNFETKESAVEWIKKQSFGNQYVILDVYRPK
jgi:hypothetical protein